MMKSDFSGRGRPLSSRQKTPFQEKSLASNRQGFKGGTEEMSMQSLLGQPIEIKPHFVMGSGDCPLALYPLLPDFNPEKVILHYHEVGAYQSEQSLNLASHLVDDHNIAVYLAELRGHGLSAGATLSKELDHPGWLLEDMDAVIDYIRKQHPQASIYLSAHGMTCSLLSHYAVKGEKRNLLSGLLFLAPYFGPVASVTSTSGADFCPMFQKVHYANLLIHSLSRGRFRSKKPGWTLAMNPSQPIRPKQKRIVTKEYFSTNWAYYLHTLSPSSLLAKIVLPISIFIPEDSFHTQEQIKEFFSQCPVKKRWHTACGVDRFCLLDHVAKSIAHDLAMSTLDVYAEGVAQ